LNCWVLSLNIADDIKDDTLVHFKVRDQEVTLDRDIARCDIPLSTLARANGSQWYSLCDTDNFTKKAGMIRLTCVFNGFSKAGNMFPGTEAHVVDAIEITDTPQGRRQQAPAPGPTELWEKCLDQKSGRYYYQNHVTRQTQWTAPPGFEDMQARDFAPQSQLTMSQPPMTTRPRSAQQNTYIYTNPNAIDASSEDSQFPQAPVHTVSHGHTYVHAQPTAPRASVPLSSQQQLQPHQPPAQQQPRAQPPAQLLSQPVYQPQPAFQQPPIQPGLQQNFQQPQNQANWPATAFQPPSQPVYQPQPAMMQPVYQQQPRPAPAFQPPSQPVYQPQPAMMQQPLYAQQMQQPYMAQPPIQNLTQQQPVQPYPVTTLLIVLIV
jgi:hypothetical protein